MQTTNVVEHIQIISLNNDQRLNKIQEYRVPKVTGSRPIADMSDVIHLRKRTDTKHAIKYERSLPYKNYLSNRRQYLGKIQ
jgi:hypothetical protein